MNDKYYVPATSGSVCPISIWLMTTDLIGFFSKELNRFQRYMHMCWCHETVFTYEMNKIIIIISFIY